MSLFPAYTQTSNNGEEKGHTTGSDTHCASKTLPTELSWLSNTSCPSLSEVQSAPLNNVEDKAILAKQDSSNVTSSLSRHKKKKKKEKSNKGRASRSKEKASSSAHVPSVKIYDSDDFYEDKKQERTNFLVETLHRPAIPRYDKYSRYFKKFNYLKRRFKKAKIKRYYSANHENLKEENSIDSSSKETELTKMTEDFNKKLADNPNDVDVWLEYVSFQDTMHQFEKTYRRNPIGGERVTAERKLAILKRAIESNPASERLLAERLSLAERTQPVDKLAEECVSALAQDPGNLSLWRTLVRTSRNNTARCTVPGVLQIFTKAVTRLGQLRVYRSAVDVEQQILSLLLECGLFLQQAGLWEQLWTLLQMYLGLSLTASGQFSVPSEQQQEDKLRQEEDQILASGLPLSVLWLRVEKLRAGCHFLPEPSCESDPQRVVFTDDVGGLLQPVMSTELRLHLVVVVLVLLKVPLLPTRHSLMLHLGLLDIPSAVNNVETLLSALSLSGICLSEGRYLMSALDLVNEPQLVREQLGRQQFMSWLLTVVQHCAELLPLSEAVLIHAWTMRLYALLCRLHCLGFSSVPASVVKHARSHCKQLLKQTQFRDNLMLYVEYSAVERSAGDIDKAIKVLETASAMSHDLENVHYMLLCRRLAESLISKDTTDHKEQAVKVLRTLGGEEQTASVVTQQTALATQPLTVVAAMTPQLLVEWLACQALLLSLTQTIWDATAFLQRHINLLPSAPNLLGGLWVEQLYEVLVDILHSHTLHNKTSYTLLRCSLVKALKLFPNNLQLLNTLATIETKSGGGGTPLWKLVSFFPPSVPLARLVLVLVVHCRVSSQSTEDVVGGRHYLTNLLHQLTEEQTTGECPLIWRLYLQLVAVLDSGPSVKQAFYKCLHHCPWVKTLYLDAVKFLPEELSEIQDLLIEKELRLHTAPEELEILRD